MITVSRVRIDEDVCVVSCINLFAGYFYFNEEMKKFGIRCFWDKKTNQKITFEQF